MHLSRFGVVLVIVLITFAAFAAPSERERQVEFNRDVRPILSDRCFQCHGPDAARRKADLRLDQENGAREVISLGKPDDSELIRRLTADPDERMPPEKMGPALTKDQISTLRRWIEQGAKYEKHWSLIAPRRPELPIVKNTAWPRNGID